MRRTGLHLLGMMLLAVLAAGPFASHVARAGAPYEHARFTSGAGKAAEPKRTTKRQRCASPRRFRRGARLPAHRRRAARKARRPAVPRGLRVVSTGDRRVVLDWKRNKGPSSRYRVHRDGKIIANGRTASRYVDNGLVNGRSYSYRVSAARRRCYSARSKAVSAVPLAPPSAPSPPAAAPPPPASSAPVPVAPLRLATLEGGDFREFDYLVNGPGTGAVERTNAYEGVRSAHMTTWAGRGNKYARGVWNVGWSPGTDVWYGAAFWLPANFYSQQQGDVDLLRWDNWTAERGIQDASGVTIHMGGGIGMVYKSSTSGEYRELFPFVAPLSLQTWHRIEVHQRIGLDGAALNELWIDGARVGTSTVHNTTGGRPTTLKVGLVAIDPDAQTNQLDVWFDSASISSSAYGR